MNMNTLKTALLVFLLAGLAACGGGDPEPEDDEHVPPPTNPCQINPKLPECA